MSGPSYSDPLDEEPGADQDPRKRTDTAVAIFRELFLRSSHRPAAGPAKKSAAGEKENPLDRP